MVRNDCVSPLLDWRRPLIEKRPKKMQTWASYVVIIRVVIVNAKHKQYSNRTIGGRPSGASGGTSRATWIVVRGADGDESGATHAGAE
jgi:hypothetical protein